MLDRPRLARALPLGLLLPGLLLIAAVQVYPALFTFYLSFHTLEPGTGRYVFNGLENFRRLLTTGIVAESLTHTAVFLGGYGALTLGCALAVALLLQRHVRVGGIVIVMIFIPWALSDVVAGIVWRLFVVPDYGLFAPLFANQALFGEPSGISVLTTPPPRSLLGGLPFPPAPAMLLLIAAAAWKALPLTTLLLLAALQTVPREVLESASIDGASGAQRLRFITLPLILPTLAVVAITLLLGGVNAVGMVFSTTSGGPGTATTVLSYLLYLLGFSRLDFGLAAALSACMALINIALALVTLRLSDQGEG
jgi:ABC-type sugar transport system permease subunit